MKIKYLYPVQDADVIKASMAPRLDTLDGVTLGLLPNAKANSYRLHEMIAEEIGRTFKLTGVKTIHKGHPSKNCDPEPMDALLQEADAVITGLGD